MNLDFFKIQHKIIPKKNDTYIEVYPEFLVKPSEHLMTRSGKFYAVLNLDNGFWETDEYKIQEYVDKAMREYGETNKEIVNLKQDDPKHCKIVIKEPLTSASSSSTPLMSERSIFCSIHYLLKFANYIITN